MADISKLIWLPVMNLYCFCEIATNSAKGAGYGALAGTVGLAAIKALPNFYTYYHCDNSLAQREITCGQELVQSSMRDGYNGVIYGAIVGAGVVFLFYQWAIATSLIDDKKN